jgi:hypothetical protein
MWEEEDMSGSKSGSVRREESARQALAALSTNDRGP